MRPLAEFRSRKIKVLFTDIDGTLTDAGRLPDSSYTSLWHLSRNGVQVVPVTGRPAGWCDMIARLWPVHGVIGENGGLVYRYDGKRMHRFEQISKEERRKSREGFKKIAAEVRQRVPGARIAADQFARRFDLAIDFAEDVAPLPDKQIQLIKSIFEKHGAHAKVSNIHVNGWYGDYDKLSTCKWYCKKWLGFELEDNLDAVAFVGDSPNDEPMFAFFKWSFAVANVKDFLPQMKHHPAFVTKAPEAAGFSELARILIK
jgi:HAD superfamily hydrolase (TIGR01484 family)